MPLTTLLQIDLRNLFYGARGQRLDLEKIWDHFQGRENEILRSAFIYVIRGTDLDNSKFESKLKSIGYTVISRNVPYLKGRPIPINHNVAIAVDCLDKLNLFDKWILLSGSGDFAPLCRYVRNKGKKIEVWSFIDNHDSSLDPYVDRIHYIDETYIYRKPKVAVFGFNNLATEGPLCDSLDQSTEN